MLLLTPMRNGAAALQWFTFTSWVRMNRWRKISAAIGLSSDWPGRIQTSYFIGPYNLHYLLFSGIGALSCHHPYCFPSQSQTLFGTGSGRPLYSPCTAFPRSSRSKKHWPRGIMRPRDLAFLPRSILDSTVNCDVSDRADNGQYQGHSLFSFHPPTRSQDSEACGGGQAGHRLVETDDQ